MTSTIKIITHDWPAQVTHYDKSVDGEWFESADEYVRPHSERTVTFHATHKIEIFELSKDARDPAAKDEELPEHTNLQDVDGEL